MQEKRGKVEGRRKGRGRRDRKREKKGSWVFRKMISMQARETLQLSGKKRKDWRSLLRKK